MSATATAPPAASVLDAFTAATRTWFTEVFARPTAAQLGAWETVSRGEHALVIAPTGSGKTLAAFLWALDRLQLSPPASTTQRCRVLYVSPLKALGVDVERNLRAPLAGIGRTAERLGLIPPDVTVGVRSGDTSPADRRRLASKPPDILITTPESLFLMLTSAAAQTLSAVETVIVDEVHAIAGSKRGAHLAVSLERLDALLDRPAQRIGLSATVRPPERVAGFLGGRHPVTVVAPPAEKRWDLEVVVPVEDMAELGTSSDITPDDPLGTPQPRSIWPHVENEILDLVERKRSSIVFTNSRRLAERLTAHLNELHAERLGELVDHDHPAPAEVMAQSGSTAGVDESRLTEVIARAHHGSMSKEQRARTEDDLKSGRLRCVVATSSLELGIDMGAVDQVIQVSSPPSVASGLQRVGRAGHQVGAVSRGVFFPNHRGDLVESAVVVERMRAGAIEEVAQLRNPLDVLAQQLVAMVAVGDQSVDEVYTLVRQAAPFADLPRSGFEAVLEMLSGRYLSEDFAELRPRLVWSRDTGMLSARPGAQRLAVTSGGTIPDRGLFGVFLVGEDNASGKHAAGRRVGELDEEMVYESRVGDVFTLGTTSWRVEQITHDQVIVSPAPGQPGRVPFWKGDLMGRPAELGRAFGRYVAEIGALPEPAALARLTEGGLDQRASRNLLAYLNEQRSTAGTLPTEDVIVLERFRDELGDWRVCLHSALGSAVLTPWALAIERNARERYGVEAQATATNDGVVLRIPDTEGEPPGADLVIIEPDELERLVRDEVGGSALFASRFRECAGRALLLPRRDPGARSPLWQQRMRSAQLLTVAARYPDFPIVLETMRECLQDVFDLPSLLDLQRAIAARRVKIVEVETRRPSPFAASLLFGYVGSFVYEGDVPLAEKKAAALSLDTSLLAELLGSDGLRQLLDPSVIVATEADLQGLSEERRPGTVEQLFDLIRTAGPVTRVELDARWSAGDSSAPAVDELVVARRLVEVRIAGADMLAVIEDLPRLRDGLGVPLPPGVAAEFAESTSDSDPIRDLVLRWARTHGPFLADDVANRYGLGGSVVDAALRQLGGDGQVVAGQFADLGSADPGGARPGHQQYCHQRVLALIKRRTLAALRQEVEPVEQIAFARFLLEWQGLSQRPRRSDGRRGAPGPAADRGPALRGVDGVLAAVEQLAGYPLPASMVESVVLPARVADYAPSMLDELTLAGDAVWTGDGPIGDRDGWVRLWPADLVPAPDGPLPANPRSAELLERLARGGSWFFDALIDPHDRPGWVQALWDLVWAGRITGDTFAPVRAQTSGGVLRRQRPPRPRAHANTALRRARPRPADSPTTVGRWSVVAGTDVDPKRRLADQLFIQLDRYGVLTRGSVLTEPDNDGGFGAAYRSLSALEESGQCRRGYFVSGLGAAQFALPGAVDRLREATDLLPGGSESGYAGRAVVLSASDPANAYGAALPWPDREGHRPGRKAGALVVLVDGALVLYVERGGKTLLSFTEDADQLGPAAGALAGAVSRGLLGQLVVSRADGDHVFASAQVRTALQDAGFTMTPQGLRLRAR